MLAHKQQISPQIQQRLDQRVQGRNQLLRLAEEIAQSDVRISAAWLFGSLGRGDADELSDIDLFLIVEDEAHEEVVANRYTYMAQLGEPLLILEAPQNWPPGGVYNMALYWGDWGPHQVDWYWVRRSQAIIPSEVVLLFDRVGLAHKAEPTKFDFAPVPERPIAEIIKQDVHLFWVMLLIGAKYLARGTDGFWFRDLYGKLAQRFDQPIPEAITSPMPANRKEQLAIFRQAANAMVDLMPMLTKSGARMPTHFPPHAHRYLDLIESIIDSMQS